MLQKFCGKRQNNTLCCPRKHKALMDDGDDDDDECEIELKKKEWTNVTLNLEELPFGGSCTYEIKAKCGYPQLVVNNTNIDMVVAFKKKKWDNDTYKPDDDDKYDDDEHDHPKEKKEHDDHDHKIEYHMPKNDKHDKGNNETECQKTKLYMTLTNLLDPKRPKQLATPRMLQVSASDDTGDERIALLQTTAAEEGAPDAASGMVFTAMLSLILLASSFVF